jgi:hypothetical protein
MYLTAYTDSGSGGVGRDSVAIYDPVGVLELGGAGSLRFEPVWPNPMRERATLAVVTPRPGRIRLDVFDVNGRLVANLADRVEPAGRRALGWGGRGSDGARVGSGLFVVRARWGGETRTPKLVIARQAPGGPTHTPTSAS